MLEGAKDAFPIGLGYFAVAFSIGITAYNSGLEPLQACLTSILCNASAGEFAGFTAIASRSSLLATALVMFIANARYLLMSCALSQRTDPDMPFVHRLLMAFDITDELFAVTIARPGSIDPWYNYGTVLTAMPMWALGTLFGAAAGELLPARLVSALSVALYGMFLAVIIPASKKNRVIAVVVGISFASSFAASVLPFVGELSEGTRTIILTVVIASAAALLCPVDSDGKRVQRVSHAGRKGKAYSNA